MSMSTSGVLNSTQIQGLIATAEQQYTAPIQTLQAQETPIQSEISALGSISSALGSLQSALAAFNSIPAMADMAANVGNSSILSVSASNTAASGTYNVTASGLAQAQSLFSQDFASESSAIGTGSISIQVGGGSATTISIGSSNDTLSGIVNAINSANAGVSASVVYDGTGYRMVLTGNQTGAANGFTVTTSGSSLSGFSYASGAYNMTESQAAQDASATVNGIAVTSATNTFSGAIAGVSFTLAATGTTTISVAQSSTALTTAIQDFASAFNQASQVIQKATAYNAASGQGGPLLGNPIVQGIENQMLGMISSATAIGSGGAQDAIGMGTAGITLTSSGTISINSSALQQAMSQNYAQVAGLFGAMAGSDNTDIQFAGASGSVAPGVYSVSVAQNGSGSTISGTIGGVAASGTNGVMSANLYNGTASGTMSVAVTPGVLASGSVFFNPGLVQSMGQLLSTALGSNGTLAQVQQGMQNTINAMNQQITSYQQMEQQSVKALTQQFSNYENTVATSNGISGDLKAIFSSLFGGSTSGG